MFDADEIVAKLERRIGLGHRPDLRRKLFRRVADLVVAHGERAYICLADVVADAEAKKETRGQYFCFVVLKRFMERRIIPPPEL